VRPAALAAVLAVLLASGASAEVEELFSKYVQVFRPKGEFAARLVRLSPPAGAGWKEKEDPGVGYRMLLPASAVVDAKPAGSRLLEVVIGDKKTRPRPVLRIDSFAPGKEDPTAVDPDYADSYADQYPDAAFNGKFALIDRGYVLLDKKLGFAMVGGVHPEGATRAYRLQWAFLSKERQLFLTFDCAEEDWPVYEDAVAQMLLSFQMPKRRKG
jgi:hypothetical protein